jgi:hypothetical protein
MSMLAARIIPSTVKGVDRCAAFAARPSVSYSTDGTRSSAAPDRAFQRDEVLDAHVHRIADPDMVAAAVLAVGDTRPSPRRSFRR